MVVVTSQNRHRQPRRQRPLISPRLHLPPRTHSNLSQSVEAGSLEEDNTITSHISQVAVVTIRHSSRRLGQIGTVEGATHRDIIITNEATNAAIIITTAATIRLLQFLLPQPGWPTIVRPQTRRPLATAESTVVAIEWGRANTTITTEIAAITITIDTQAEAAITLTPAETT